MRNYALVLSGLLSLTSFAQCLYTIYEPGHVEVLQGVVLKDGAKANFQLARKTQSASIRFSLPSDSLMLAFDNGSRIDLREAIDGAYPTSMEQLIILRNRDLDSILVFFNGARTAFPISDAPSRIGLQTSAGCVLNANLSTTQLPTPPVEQASGPRTAGRQLERAGIEKNLGIAIALTGTLVAGLIAADDQGNANTAAIIATGSLIAAGSLMISGNIRLVRAGRILQEKGL